MRSAKLMLVLWTIGALTLAACQQPATAAPTPLPTQTATKETPVVQEEPEDAPTETPRPPALGYEGVLPSSDTIAAVLSDRYPYYTVALDASGIRLKAGDPPAEISYREYFVADPPAHAYDVTLRGATSQTYRIVTVGGKTYVDTAGSGQCASMPADPQAFLNLPFAPGDAVEDFNGSLLNTSSINGFDPASQYRSNASPESAAGDIQIGSLEFWIASVGGTEIVVSLDMQATGVGGEQIALNYDLSIAQAPPPIAPLENCVEGAPSSS